LNVVGIGQSIPRKEAPEKVTGAAKYNDDFKEPDLLHAFMATSPYAHAKIISIDTSKAWETPGVLAVITGESIPFLCGPMIEDRPPLAKGKVRYFGEPIAVVVARSESEAKSASDKIKIQFEQLPVVNSPSDALKPGVPLVHEWLGMYHHFTGVYPEPGTNIVNRVKIRKGDMAKGWAESHIIVKGTYLLPQSDHVAMETRSARAEIRPDGAVIIHSSTQAPHSIRKVISRYFHVEVGKVIVHTPFVGGGFGGKAAVQLEIIAVLASKAVGGKKVRIANTREQDMASSPSHIGFEGKVRFGATKDGKIIAAEMTYLYDTGAYADSGPKMTRSGAVSCTGPYNIENVWCDSICVYTNHSYSTAYRGFGHPEFTTAIERTMDKLAFALGMDPLELRMKNAIAPGHTSPTQVKLTPSKVGNLSECIQKVKQLINWEEGQRIEIGNNKVRAKGMGCLWKTSSSPTNAISAVVLTMNSDGTINLNCGVVEFGNSTKTTLAQILAERMGMDVSQVHVKMEVDTQVSPIHWKTVASMTTYMAGNAVLDAAEDMIKQLKSIASIVLQYSPEGLEVGGGKVFVKANPDFYVDFKDIAHGYKYPNDHAIGGQIIGKGQFIMNHLTSLDKETGKGQTGPYWTVGAQAVEVEFDMDQCTYRLTKAATVIDAGKLINPKSARGIVMGGISMGLALGSRESFEYDNAGILKNTSLRTYKPLRIGENPEYLVEFVETPNITGPYSVRGFGEHGILAIPGALMNSLSSAAQIDINQLPITPEYIWKKRKGKI
jgi:CO/xanthine dehydrogenase Mo-binding subunit